MDTQGFNAAFSLVTMMIAEDVDGVNDMVEAMPADEAIAAMIVLCAGFVTLLSERGAQHDIPTDVLWQQLAAELRAVMIEEGFDD